MCQYCSYRRDDGWTQLVSYDETYRAATVASRSESESESGPPVPGTALGSTSE